MRPGARLAAVIELCQIIDREQVPAHRIIDAWFKRRRYAGAKDRRAIINQVYRIIRSHARLGWWIEQVNSSLQPVARLRVIADVALNDKIQPAEIQALFSGTNHCPDVLSEDEISLAVAIAALAEKPGPHEDHMPLNVRLEFPRWLKSGLQKSFGDRLDGEMAALNTPACTDVRVNTLKTTFKKAQAALEGEGIQTEPTGFSPVALRLSGNIRLGASPAFKQGLIEVQDEGSQLIALLTDARPGMCVVDFCAGAGGKTLALAAHMTSGKATGRTRDRAVEGTLVACDTAPHRLKRLKPRLDRAGIKAVHTRLLSGEADPWITANGETADRVLLDAPCTGTGTWRRDPCARWRLQPEDVERSVETQRSILASAQTLVKPGGRLVYATCSILTEENEQQMDWFLSEYPAFRALNIPRIWRVAIGGDRCPCKGLSLRLSPALTRTDGFFCAVLERMI